MAKKNIVVSIKDKKLSTITQFKKNINIFNLNQLYLENYWKCFVFSVFLNQKTYIFQLKIHKFF